MIVGWVADPLKWDRWPEVEAMLEPALKLADDQTQILEDGHLLWAVMDGDDLLAAATARLTEDRCEVILVGGRDYRRWLGDLDTTLGAAARDAGATRLAACGRAGWCRALKALGWDSLGEADGMTVYSRELSD